MVKSFELKMEINTKIMKDLKLLWNLLIFYIFAGYIFLLIL